MKSWDTTQLCCNPIINNNCFICDCFLKFRGNKAPQALIRSLSLFEVYFPHHTVSKRENSVQTNLNLHHQLILLIVWVRIILILINKNKILRNLLAHNAVLFHRFFMLQHRRWYEEKGTFVVLASALARVMVNSLIGK